ncbi:hypothetical protein B0T25DRAFT_524558 [Lasiosphaeria hispida]|uniref:Uncharacterized protein n=1 Tax=Lasiosphaeria hispida TaxID=260671 RepID=A0AAJ0HTI3_9PEZI|nr:hypothetical protein B0T25DRAFT_524558 [Lasiosphaeria hispida]
MPPHFPQPSLNGVQAALRLRATTTSTSPTPTTASSIWRRPTPSAAFSTTPAPRDGPAPIPPESPRFIQVPEPPQSSEVKQPPMRGHLPVPRPIFPKREGNTKAKKDYIARTAPLSAAEQAGKQPRSEVDARHRLDAASRRHSLAAGLQGLWARKKVQDQQVATRMAAHQAANQAAAMAPERLEDLLTRGTVRASTALATAVIPDPARFETAEQARKRHAEIAARKSEARRDALAQLYVAAGDFIVDEEELEAKIDKLFTEAPNRPGGPASIWATKPISVEELRAEISGQGTSAASSMRSSATKTAMRQRTLAEELTGGKM